MARHLEAVNVSTQRKLRQLSRIVMQLYSVVENGATNHAQILRYVIGLFMVR
jgi:hypothetical protein